MNDKFKDGKYADDYVIVKNTLYRLDKYPYDELEDLLKHCHPKHGKTIKKIKLELKKRKIQEIYKL